MVPDWMYRRTISVEWWPVCRMIARSGAPPAAAEVANPLRSECPSERCRMGNCDATLPQIGPGFPGAEASHGPGGAKPTWR